MYEHLDVAADLIARECDHVVLGRSLGSMVNARAPIGAYLHPQPDLVEAVSGSVRDAIGVVWRSEFDHAVRSIHYLRPEHLAALGQLGRPVVCLQHDARPEEREELERALGASVRFLDDIDLRDDFETMAAVAAGLYAVVGIGTTFVELAGAVGTTTVMLYPNRVGVWRRCDGDRDFWHRSMHAVFSGDLRDRSKVVDEAVRILRVHGVPAA